MGCGAVSKVGVADSVQPISKSNASVNSRNNSNQKLNGNSNNGYNNNKTQAKPLSGANSRLPNNRANSNGFKQVEIKYSNDYANDNNIKNKPPISSNKSNGKPVANGAPVSNGKPSNSALPVANGKPPSGPPNNNNNNKNNSNDKSKAKPNDIKKASNSNDLKKNSLPPVQYKEPVAFTITFDDNKANIEEILKNKPQARFQLEPLKERPKLTQEQIDEKMRAVELKREQILAQRSKPSKVSTMRQDTIKQRQTYETETNLYKIENSLDSASKQREAKLEEIKEKQRRQDEKRQRIIKDRRNIANQELEDLRYNEMERDRYYNRDYDDF